MKNQKSTNPPANKQNEQGENQEVERVVDDLMKQMFGG